MKHIERDGIGVLTTGGTMDKTYDPITETNGFSRPSRIPDMLERARLAPGLIREIGHVMAKDSLDMDDADRQDILRAAQGMDVGRIVITHGTGTMTETGRVLGGDPQLRDEERTIVMTGAMIPDSIEGSDAASNLGFALASAQLLESGVYVAMNGVARPYDDVAKNTEIGMFEETGLWTPDGGRA